MNTSIPFLCLALVCGMVFSQTHSANRALENEHHPQAFLGFFWENPANYSTNPLQQLSSVSLGYVQQRNHFKTLQQPTANDYFSLQTESFLRTDSLRTLWGNARYVRGLEKEFTLRESQWDGRIAPYFTADTTFTQHTYEHYSLLGGYAKQTRYGAYGIQMDYKAQLHSHHQDPRAKSVSSNFHLLSGLRLRLLPALHGYAQAGMVHYTQTNHIKFFRTNATAQVYHLNPFGYYHPYFKGKSLTSLYDGLGYDLSLGADYQKKYFFHYHRERFSFEKIIEQTLGAKVSSAAQTLTAATLLQWNKHQAGWCASYGTLQKTSSEPQLERKGQQLKVVRTKEQYHKQDTHFSLSGFYFFSPQHTYLAATISRLSLYEQYEIGNNFIHSEKWMLLLSSKLPLLHQRKYAMSYHQQSTFTLSQHHRASLAKHKAQLITQMVHSYEQSVAQSATSLTQTLSIYGAVSPQYSAFIKLHSHLLWQGKKVNHLLSFSIGAHF